MKKQNSHRNSRDFRDFYIKGKFYCTSSTIWGDKDKNNMYYFHFEVRKKYIQIEIYCYHFLFCHLKL